MSCRLPAHRAAIFGFAMIPRAWAVSGAPADGGLRAREPARLPLLPGMDGLRAVAVLGVVLYHLGAPWLPGGFLGVDVFFVLSGFLITTLVVEEVERTGRVSLPDFYLRRARRLLPALILLLAVVSLLALVAFPEERGELRRDVVAALLYVSNWSYVLADQSYFEAVGRPPLLQHLWSLAVEEQFYLLWPAAVAGAMLVGRRRVRRVALLAALVSTGWMTTLAVRNGYPVPSDPSRAYFGTDTHAMGLLLGAALATVWAPWRVWASDRSWLASSRPAGQRTGAAVVDLVGVVALVGIGWVFVTVDEFSPLLYRGGFLALAGCTALLVAALAHPAGLLGRALAVQPLRYLGERSYGIYLWHWPVVLLTRPGFELPFGGWLSVLLRLGLIVAAAEVSYRYVERPIRAGALGELVRRVRWLGSQPGTDPAAARAKVVGGAVACSVAFTAIGVGLFTAPASSGSSGGDTGLVQPRPGSTADQAGGAPASDVADCRSISIFGDSVVYGAAYEMRAAGACVSAAEGNTFGQVLANLSAAREQGNLPKTVIVHAGNNGPADKDALDNALEALTDRDVYLVNLHVPQAWEAYNNTLFDRVAARYPNVTVLDWNRQASKHEEWLYADRVHLTAGSGRAAYVRWVLRLVGSPSDRGEKSSALRSGDQG